MIEVFGIAFSIMGELNFLEIVSSGRPPRIFHWSHAKDRHDLLHDILKRVFGTVDYCVVRTPEVASLNVFL